MVEPARAWLGAAPTGAIAVPVSAAWLTGLRAGDAIELLDARGARRTLRAVDATPTGALVEVHRTTYLHTGARLHAAEDCVVGELPPVEQPLVVRPGDTLRVTRDGVPGSAGPPPHIPCTLPQVSRDVRSGDRIWFDDGAIGGRVRAATLDVLEVEITEASPTGSKLRSDKDRTIAPSGCVSPRSSIERLIRSSRLSFVVVLDPVLITAVQE